MSDNIDLNTFRNKAVSMGEKSGTTGDKPEESLIKLAQAPRGLVLVCGPTGSGKSTTLAAIIDYANETRDAHIITVEDPIEFIYHNKRCVIDQREVGRDAPSCAEALKRALHEDPDIILVGEIRDSETAKIAIEAALTGHLVLSTLHANDAPSAVTRLIEMGVEPFRIAQSLTCVIAQRFVRRLCSNCKREHTLTEEEFKALQLPGDYQPVKIYEPVGCKECKRGYRGRIIHEVILMNGELEKLIANDATTDDIAKAAARNGMVRLRQDCWAKVLSGDTSVAEVLHATLAD